MKFDKEFLHGIMSEKESSISVRSRFLKSNKKTNRAKNRKLTMISFLPAIIWLILLLVLSSQNGPQTAATSLPMAEWIQQHFFPQDSVDYVHMYLRKWAHFIVYFIESGLFFSYLSLLNTPQQNTFFSPLRILLYITNKIPHFFISCFLLLIMFSQSHINCL